MPCTGRRAVPACQRQRAEVDHDLEWRRSGLAASTSRGEHGPGMHEDRGQTTKRRPMKITDPRCQDDRPEHAARDADHRQRRQVRGEMTRSPNSAPPHRPMRRRAPGVDRRPRGRSPHQARHALRPARPSGTRLPWRTTRTGPCTPRTTGPDPVIASLHAAPCGGLCSSPGAPRRLGRHATTTMLINFFSRCAPPGCRCR